MSQENVSLVDEAVDAFNRRDLRVYLSLFNSDCEWHPLFSKVEGGEAYHGHEGIRSWWTDSDAAFDEVELAFDEIRDLGDTAVALGRFHIRSKSGVPLDIDYAAIIKFEDGRVASFRAYASHDEALKAAGLSE